MHLSALDPSEIKDRSMMYEWLWQKFKRWGPISDEVKKIRRSREGSHRRTWNYLFGAIRRHLDYVHEDLSTMNKELDKWEQDYKAHATQLEQEIKITDDMTQPLKLKLKSFQFGN